MRKGFDLFDCRPATPERGVGLPFSHADPGVTHASHSKLHVHARLSQSCTERAPMRMVAEIIKISLMTRASSTFTTGPGHY